MLIKDIKEKHPEIYKRAKECSRKTYKFTSKERTKYIGSAFYFNETLEGQSIWEKVNTKNFQPFYDYHNIPNPDKK